MCPSILFFVILVQSRGPWCAVVLHHCQLRWTALRLLRMRGDGKSPKREDDCGVYCSFDIFFRTNKAEVKLEQVSHPHSHSRLCDSSHSCSHSHSPHSHSHSSLSLSVSLSVWSLSVHILSQVFSLLSLSLFLFLSQAPGSLSALKFTPLRWEFKFIISNVTTIVYNLVRIVARCARWSWSCVRCLCAHMRNNKAQLMV